MAVLYFNEDHEGIRDMVREFAEKELAAARHEIDETEKMPEELVETISSSFNTSSRIFFLPARVNGPKPNSPSFPS